MPKKGIDGNLLCSAPAPRRGPRPSEATAAPRSPCPSSSILRTSCSRRTASRNMSTTSTVGAALMVSMPAPRGMGQGVCALLCWGAGYGGRACTRREAGSYRTTLLVADVFPQPVASMSCVRVSSTGAGCSHRALLYISPCAELVP